MHGSNMENSMRLLELLIFAQISSFNPLKTGWFFRFSFRKWWHTRWESAYFSLHFFLVFLPSFLELSDNFLSKIATVRWLCRRVAVGPREATQSFIRACCSIYSTMDWIALACEVFEVKLQPSFLEDYLGLASLDIDFVLSSFLRLNEIVL